MSSTAPHQVLYRRWRAQTFGQIVGQEAVVATLRNAVRLSQVAHALLFVGPRGTGKTSLARIVAKALNCTNLRDGEPCDRCEACVAIREGRALDVIEMDAASNNRVDDMRELLARTMTAPSDLRRKVYIVDEVQRIKEGWDVLLKSLEEPPEHVVFVFCTTDASQIRPAVLSRVQRYDFRRLSVPQIEGKLRMILEADGRAAEPEALSLVARLAAGGMRDAESMLDQLLASGADRLTADHVRDLLGLAEIESVERLVDALVLGDVLGGIAVLDDLEEHGRDLRAFLDQVVETIRAGLVDVLSGRMRTPGAASAEQLAAAGQRLGQIDPARGGPGGLRFQLELALFASPGPVGAESGAVREPAAAAARPVRRPEPPTRPTAEPSAVPLVAPSSMLPVEPAASVVPRPVPPPPAAPSAAPPLEPPVPAAQPSAVPAPSASPRPRRAGAPVTPETPRAASAPSAAAEPDPLGELRHHWPDIVAHISRHPPTKPLITACRPIAVDGNIVTLGFPEGQTFLRDVAERRRGILEEGVGHYLGRAVNVRCVATNLDLVPPLPENAEDSRLLAEARRIFADDLVDVGEVG